MRRTSSEIDNEAEARAHIEGKKTRPITLEEYICAYELNRLNTGKPGFTEDGEMIMGPKFKYFKKADKKGQKYSG